MKSKLILDPTEPLIKTLHEAQRMGHAIGKITASPEIAGYIGRCYRSRTSGVMQDGRILFYGIQVFMDEKLPDGTIQIWDHTGREAAKISKNQYCWAVYIV